MGLNSFSAYFIQDNYNKCGGMWMSDGKKYYKICMLTIVLIIFGVILSLVVGPVYISPVSIIKILIQKVSLLKARQFSLSITERDIIVYLRLPRIVLAFLVGAELSAAGVIYQGVFRNPMADPYIIGSSAGASLGATLAIIFLPGYKIFGIGPIPFFAFIGALTTVFLVYSLASMGGRTYSQTLLLAGIAVGSFITALVSFFMSYSTNQLHRIYFWIIGNFSFQGWNEIKLNIPYAAIGFLIGLFNLRALNILQLGEDTAFFTGVDVERLKKVSLVSAALLTASAVSVSGIIGFVGLVVPHIVRILIGPDHRRLFVLSSLIGGLYLMLADTISRVIIKPSELPVGILTALLGGPFFLYLLFLKKNKDYRL
jgi:iron complex transport system permease protein